MIHVKRTIYNLVSLVERNSNPSGHSLVNAEAIVKKAPTDLVELAMEIQKVRTHSSA